MVGKSRRNPVTDDQIIASYENTHSIYATAATLGIGETTVHRVLVKHQVPRFGLVEWRERATKFRGQEHEIRGAYETGMTVAQLCERFGNASAYAFKHAIRRAGGIIRENVAPLIKPGELDRIRQMHAAGMGQIGISLALGRSQSFISRVMRNNGIKTHLSKGPSHSMWKGGRYKTSGYFIVWVSDDDAMAGMRNNAGYVMEHRLVMARKLGRPLRRSETVHHINGDRIDNRPENLELRQGKHGKHVAMRCLDCGSVNVGHAKLGGE